MFTSSCQSPDRAFEWSLVGKPAETCQEDNAWEEKHTDIIHSCRGNDRDTIGVDALEQVNRQV